MNMTTILLLNMHVYSTKGKTEERNPNKSGQKGLDTVLEKMLHPLQAEVRRHAGQHSRT